MFVNECHISFDIRSKEIEQTLLIIEDKVREETNVFMLCCFTSSMSGKFIQNPSRDVDVMFLSYILFETTHTLFESIQFSIRKICEKMKNKRFSA